MEASITQTWSQYLDQKVWTPFENAMISLSGKRLTMLFAAIRNPSGIGTVMSCSPWTAARMIRQVTESECKGSRRILEIGAGQGPITVPILRDLQPGDSLDIVEGEEIFRKALQQVIDDSGKAEQVRLHCPKLIADFKPEEGQKFHHVVSTLPLNLFDPKAVEAFHHQLDSELLEKGGSYSYIELIGAQVNRAARWLMSPFYAKPYQALTTNISLKNEHLDDKERAGALVHKEIEIFNILPARVIHVSWK